MNRYMWVRGHESPTAMDPENLQVGATGTAFGVVEELADRGGAGVTELASALGLSKSAVHKHLTTLVELGYAEKRAGEYRLGVRFHWLGERARRAHPLFPLVESEVENLAANANATAGVLVEDRGEGLYLHRRGRREADVRVSLFRTAVGKALLAHLPEDRRRELLAEAGARDGALRRELRAARDRGLVVDYGGDGSEYNAVAAPITDGEGAGVAAVGVSGPRRRLAGKRLEEDVSGLVVSTAKRISVELDRSL